MKISTWPLARSGKQSPLTSTVPPTSVEGAEALGCTFSHSPGGVGAPAAGGASTTAGAAAHVMASRSPAPRRTAAWPRRTNIGTPSTRQNGPVILYGGIDASLLPGQFIRWQSASVTGARGDPKEQ